MNDFEIPELHISVCPLGFSFSFDEILTQKQIDLLEVEIDKVRKHDDVLCDYCEKEAVSVYYLIIISKLREAGLFPDGFKYMCCDCYASEENKKVVSKYVNSISDMMKDILEDELNENFDK